MTTHLYEIPSLALGEMPLEDWLKLWQRSAPAKKLGLSDREITFEEIKTYLELQRWKTGEHSRALLAKMIREREEGNMPMEVSSVPPMKQEAAPTEPGIEHAHHPVLHAHQLAYLPGEAYWMNEWEEDDVSEMPTRIMTSIPTRLHASSFPKETEGDYVAETHLLVESAIIKYVSRYQDWPAQICLNPWRRLYGLERWLRYWWLLDRNNGVYADVISEQGLPEDVVECIPPSSRDENPVLAEGESIEEDESDESQEEQMQENWGAAWLYADNFTALEMSSKEVPQEVTIGEGQNRPEEEGIGVETEKPAEETEGFPEPEGALGTDLMDNDAMGAGVNRG